jgi:AcrR family transcriptional regulator
MAKMGRPTCLNKQLKEIAVGLAREKGATIRSIAAKLGIGKSTLYLYLQKDKDFLDNLEKGLAMADDLVELSLFRRAIGYTHGEEKIFYDSVRGKTVREKTIRHYPPSEAAMAMWLKCRRRADWGDKANEDETKDIPIVIAKDEQNL